MKSLANKELQAEECIRKDLVDRYQKIATRITDHKGEEIREYAEAILSRKFNINQEIDSLKLPSLAWKDIIGITKPVFDAAQEVLDRQVEAL